MDEIRLLQDWPNLPKGTILVKDENGFYKDQNNVLTMSQSYVDENSSSVEPVKELELTKSLYYFLSDAGEVQSKTWEGSQIDLARQSFGNFFVEEKLALDLKSQVQDIYLKVPHGVK